MKLRASQDLKLGTPSGTVRILKGEEFTLPTLEPAVHLVRKGKAFPEPCPWCRRHAWWISIYGNVICGNCHPPATPEIVEAFLEVPCGN